MILTVSANLHNREKYFYVSLKECTFLILSNHPEHSTKMERVIGDVNLFISVENTTKIGELNIMIAESAFRGLGYGNEAVLLMMAYGIRSLNIKEFMCKINAENQSSLKLFKRYLYEYFILTNSLAQLL